MAHVLRMPEVAANVTEAVLHEWFVADQAQFEAADPIAAVETDKAVVEVEAEAAGVVLRLLVPAGSQVDVGAPIALLGGPGEQPVDVDAVLAELGVVAPEGTAPERRTVPDTRVPEPPPRNSSPDPAPPAAAPVPAAAAPQEPAVASPDGGSRRIFSSPLARRVARDAGLPLDEITGTGPHGRITRRDVEAALNARTTAPSPSDAAPQSSKTVPPDSATMPSAPNTVPPVPGTVPPPPGPTPPSPGPTPPSPSPTPPSPVRPRHPAAHEDTPHSRMRNAIATRLTESKRDVPHFYLRATVRADRLLALRTRLNGPGDLRISVNDLVVKAAARAHTLVPAMNVVWLPGALRRFTAVDVSVAMVTERGLVTPVLRGVDSMTVSAVSAGVRDFAARARDGRLRQEELEGGALTVTNLGMYGTEEFAAIINPPQSAILAVGAAHEEPVAVKGRVVVRSVLRVTLSVDHRAVDGVLAAEWMRAFVAVLEEPVRILA
ncbi:dihydrolipoamide acetyltransferase family protein [Streptomyces sp. NPDC088387]|uniref:dihydrolipoamide acetyltransferase family protein n=1 Tax=Streptomyces sp. NPDC088387 TaxID=3365859 RepID=UPI0038011780